MSSVSSPSAEQVFDWIDARAQARHQAGLARRIRHRSATDTAVDLAGNDYLGLSKDKRVVGAAAAAALTWGAGATGSRLVSGSTELHTELELELASFYGAQAALVFSSGYLANLAVLTALGGPGTAIVADKYIHASLIDGCRLSAAEVAVVAHCDTDAVRHALATRKKNRALVVTDSVFSVDGDRAPLTELAAACRDHGAGLIIDDAHGFGVLDDHGRGAVNAAGLAGEPNVVSTITLSKALGAQGGAVLGPRRVIHHLVDTARGFIFDTGLAPSSTAAALTALRILKQNPEKPARVRQLAVDLAARLADEGLSSSVPDAAVVSVQAPSPEAAVHWAEACRAAGVRVGCFRPPSTPDQVSRLRLTVRADLTDAELDRAVAVLSDTAPPPAG